MQSPSTSSPATCELPDRILSLGESLDLSPERFGFLRESSAVEAPQELRQRIDADGYLYLREFWDRSAVQEVRDSLIAQLQNMNFLKPGTDPDEALFNGREIGRAFGNPLNQRDPVLRGLLFGPRITEFFETFLGGTVRHFDYVWFRTKGPGLGSPLHCDLVYMGRGTHDLYTVWVPFGDIDLKLGGLLVLEGSHNQSERLSPYLSRDVDTYCTNREDAADYASGKKWWDGTLSKHPVWLQKALGGRWLTSPEFRMGDAVVFNMTLVHGSLDNQTDRFRLSTDIRFQLEREPIDSRWIGETPPGHALSERHGRVC